MTEAQAKKELRRRLTFGDERQILAVRFLDSLADCIEHLKENPECENCDSLGEYYQDCPSCEGAGCDECDDGEVLEECAICGGTGILVVNEIPHYSLDVLEAARARLVREHTKVSRGAA